MANEVKFAFRNSSTWYNKPTNTRILEKLDKYYFKTYYASMLLSIIEDQLHLKKNFKKLKVLKAFVLDLKTKGLI